MSRESAARRRNASRRAAEQARAEPTAGSLSHRDQRRVRAIARARELASRRRHREFRHVVIVVLSGIAAAAVVGAALGFGPAVEAASGNGTVGTFVVSGYQCPRRGACKWVGTFEARSDVVGNAAYEGNLAMDTQPGTHIPARYPGFGQAYSLHGSRTWASDLILMIFIGAVAGFLVWLSPLGLRERGARAHSASGYPPGAQL
jgi:hypothetical protein